MSHTLSAEMERCVEACTTCAHVCLETAMNHCLETGGRHVEPDHFRLMTNCAEICRTAANFMLSSSSLHGVVCGACAHVCEACAASCADIGGMDDCVEACRACAESCRRMAGSPAGPKTGRKSGAVHPAH